MAVRGALEIMMNCNMQFLFYRTHAADTYVDVHKHNCFELVYYSRGTGSMNLNGTLYTYSPGTMTFTRPNHYHDERHFSETDVLYIGFNYDDHPLYFPNGLYFDNEDQTILQLMEKMKDELIGKKAHYTLKIDLLVQLLLIELERIGNHHTDPAGLDPLFYARRYIEENFTQKINLQQLADNAGYSYDYFRHLFKQKTGLAPVQYLIAKRLDQAKSLLKNTDASIASIALECGFSSSSQFSMLFKKVSGVMPKQYRSRQKTAST
jgi:AraC-like DNA-binding protein